MMDTEAPTARHTGIGIRQSLLYVPNRPVSYTFYMIYMVVHSYVVLWDQVQAQVILQAVPV